MIGWLINLKNQWNCEHAWKTHADTEVYSEFVYSNRPIRRELLLICDKCKHSRIITY
jgi:hypothetical protein